MAIFDVVFTALVIATTRVISRTALGQSEGVGSSRWNVSATAEDGLINVTAQYTPSFTEDNRLALQLTCPTEDAVVTSSSNNLVFATMRGTCGGVRARSVATFTVTALSINRVYIGSVSRNVYVHDGVPWRPVEIARIPTRINTSVVLVWRTAYAAPSDGFLLTYWCAGNGNANGSAPAHELRTRARLVTLKQLDECEEYEVRLYTVNEYGISPPLDFRFCANETQIQISQPVTLLKIRVIAGLTVSCCLLVFALSIVGSLTFRHFRERNHREPQSPQSSDTEAGYADAEAEPIEHMYLNTGAKDQFYENANRSLSSQELEADAASDPESAREMDSEYDPFESADESSSSTSETAEGDNVYEEVSSTSKTTASPVQNTANPSHIRAGARGKGGLGKKPKPDPRPQTNTGRKPKPDPRPKVNTGRKPKPDPRPKVNTGRRPKPCPRHKTEPFKDDVSYGYARVCNVSHACANELGGNGEGGAEGNGPTDQLYANTPETSDETYINLLPKARV